jgi:pyruvate,orthophosphate dikinase
MFMSQERLPVMQAMIMADNKLEREQALTKLLPMQTHDFIEIFKAMHGLPVTIRLLDPPLHEFLPKLEDLVLDPEINKKQKLLNKVKELKEANPMMGLRGCRLGLLYPEINEMQVRAIFAAAISVKKEGLKVLPEIMIPLISDAQELLITRKHLEAVAKKVMDEYGQKIDYSFGTMIEIPRACVTAGEIAQYAQFFSFGTNDLTQMTYGFSRDDAEGKFLTRYLEGVRVNGESIKIMSNNPFEILDRKGVGKLMKLAIEYGLQSNPALKLGVCGEHGGEPSSIEFFEELGLTYISCSPYRLPIARLAAAQARIKRELNNKVLIDK